MRITGILCLLVGFSAPALAGDLPCPGNLDEDAIVGPFDLAFLLGTWGQCPDPCTPGDPESTCAADFNGDCVVGAFDLAFLLGAWGPCPGPPVNDVCEGAIEIFDGDTDFDTTGANTDGPPQPGCEFSTTPPADVPRNDVWFTHTATCTGLLKVCTCNQAFWDTNLVLYEGCDCPATAEQFLACNEDEDGCLLFTSRMLAPVDAGVCYKIRLGGFLDQHEGTGTLTVSCVEGVDSSCCFPHDEVGCDDQACEDVVCKFDTWCCETNWDEACVEEAIAWCGDLCEGMDGCDLPP